MEDDIDRYIDEDVKEEPELMVVMDSTKEVVDI